MKTSKGKPLEEIGKTTPLDLPYCHPGMHVHSVAFNNKTKKKLVRDSPVKQSGFPLGGKH